MPVSAGDAAPYPVLYSFRRCPYAMRARLALLASDTVCELREVVLARKPAALLQTSPKATVPVLVLPDGPVLEQSLDIMLWALRRNDPRQWLPAGEQDWITALQLIAQCDGDFKAQLDRYKYPNRYALPDGQSHRTAGAQFLHMLNDRLACHSHLMGAHFGLADAAIAPFVRQFAHTDPTWFADQDWPALQQWLAAFEASGDYTKVMERFAAWTEGEATLLFPA
jgi:glutathione S-transferase